MIERIIENWLTEIDERGYQIPFCQVLALKGHTILYTSTHGPLEQGKDIIVRNPEGKLLAYQLKAGDISMSQWRNTVRGEVEALLDLPVVRPGISKDEKHKSFLVVSGKLADVVNREIDDFNEKRKREGKPTLTLMTKGELLRHFVDANEGFLPTGITDIQSFLNLYTSNGRNPLNKRGFVNFLSSIIPSTNKATKRVLQRSATNIILFGSYLLAPYVRQKNYWATVDGWIMAMSLLMQMAERYDGYDDIDASIKLCHDAIHKALVMLRNESLESPDLLQYGSVFDGRIYPYRVTILCGYIAGYCIFRYLQGIPEWQDEAILMFIKKYIKEIKLFSEGAVPLFINIIWYLRLSGENEMAQGLLRSIILAILTTNKRDGTGIIDPYHELEEVVRHFLRLKDEPIDETFQGSSYTLESLVLLSAKDDDHQFIAENWQSISHIEYVCFNPESMWEFFAYRAKDGQKVGKFPNQIQSWKELHASSQAENNSEIPKGFQLHSHFLPLFLLTYPHRLRPSFILFVDKKITTES